MVKVMPPLPSGRPPPTDHPVGEFYNPTAATLQGGALQLTSNQEEGGNPEAWRAFYAAEFFGIFRNDMPAIVRVQLDASGDGLWAVDNLEYGGEPVPEPGTLALLGLGMAGLGLKKRRSQR